MKIAPSNPEQDPIANSDNPAPEEVPQWVVLAQLLRPQGRKGEILAELLTDFPERFDANRRVFLAPSGFSGYESAARVAEVVAHWLPVGKNAGRIVLHLSNIDSIEAAGLLCGLDVLVPASERMELEDDSHYISDLIGCTVYDLAQRDISSNARTSTVGTVVDVHFATTPDGGRRLDEAAPLLTVETPEGEEVLIPFVKAFILSLDPARKRIEMSLPAGLIEVNRTP